MTEKMRRPEAVIFDLDGTLTNTEIIHQKAWREVLRSFGYETEPWMSLELRSLGHPFNRQRMTEWFGETFPFDEIRACKKAVTEKLLTEYGITLKPGAAELLQWLKKENITIALATSSESARAERCLKEAGILSYFDRILCADMVKQGKPAPDTYLSACRQLGILPEHAFAVEDSPNGIRSAYQAGCHVIMVPDLTQPDEELKKLLYACVDSLSDIIPVLG